MPGELIDWSTLVHTDLQSTIENYLPL